MFPPGRVSLEVICIWSISSPWIRLHLALAVAYLMRHPSDGTTGSGRMSRQALWVYQFPPGQGQDKRPLMLESVRGPWQVVRKVSLWKRADWLNASRLKGQGFVLIFVNTYHSECSDRPFTYILTITYANNKLGAMWPPKPGLLSILALPISLLPHVPVSLLLIPIRLCPHHSLNSFH